MFQFGVRVVVIAYFDTDERLKLDSIHTIDSLVYLALSSSVDWHWLVLTLGYTIIITKYVCHFLLLLFISSNDYGFCYSS